MDGKPGSGSLTKPKGRSTHRRWLEAAIAVPEAEVQLAADILLDLGSQGVITAVTDFTKPKRSSRQTVRGFFPVKQRATVEKAVKRLLRAWPGRQLRPRVEYRTIDEQHWETNWREHFKPIAVGKRLLVAPPWHKVRSKRVPIIIKPGMAFGTGQHETTQACLAAIDRLLLKWRPRRALDLGTGTGILAIAMARLGIREVIAIDTDPTALSAARENVKVNGVGKRVRLSARPLPRLMPGAGKMPLVVANLYAEVLAKLECYLHRLLPVGGLLVVSGILVSREGALLEAFPAERWRFVSRSCRGEWVTRTLIRRATRVRTN